VAWHYSLHRRHRPHHRGHVGPDPGRVSARAPFHAARHERPGFFAPADKHERLAEAFAKDPDTGAAVELINVRAAPRLEMGGGGLVSTMDDYARFLLMLYRGGTLGSARTLSRKTIAFTTADHLGPEVRIGTRFLLAPGHGFGLGFACAVTPEWRRRRVRWSKLLGRHRWHGVLDRAAGGTDRPDDDPGARSARLLPPALPLSDARRARCSNSSRRPRVRNVSCSETATQFRALE